MHNALYFTLAKSNLKKNRAIYLPYLLANVLIVSMYYILTSIRSMMQTYETTQGSNTDLMLRFCTVVAVIMAFIILFYVMVTYGGYQLCTRAKQAVSTMPQFTMGQVYTIFPIAGVLCILSAVLNLIVELTAKPEGGKSK